MANCPRNENTVPLSFYWNALFAALPTIRQVIASTPPPITPPTTGTILVRLIMPFSPAFVKSLNPTISLILTSRDRGSCSITLYVILLDAEAPKGFVVLLNRHIKCFLTLHNISCLKTVIHKDGVRKKCFRYAQTMSKNAFFKKLRDFSDLFTKCGLQK